MKRNLSMTAAPHQCDARRARGSAVILVVISLLLLVMMATAYLQTVRVQRFPEAEPRGAMDSVIESILRKIEGDIERSLDLEEPEQFALHDYPWTNPWEDEDNHFFHVPYVWEDDGLQHRRLNTDDFENDPPPGVDSDDQPFGGYQDRAWLAANEPWFDGDDPTWSHISNMTGVYLDYDRGTNDFNVDPGSGIPLHHFVTHADSEHRPSELIPFDDNFLVDATGDGIPDSRWTWAPLWRADGLVYVMAVRIVDLGGMVNANLALGLTDTDGEYDTSDDGADAPRWAYPSELDFGRFVYDTTAPVAPYEEDHMEDLEALLEYRFRADWGEVGLPVAWNAGNFNRQDFWADWGRFADHSLDDAQSDDYRRYALASEYRLRHRGGLVRDAAPEAIERYDDPDDPPASWGMGRFLRADDPSNPASDEPTWEDVDLTRYDDGVTAPPNELRDFFELEPRHQMATMSGAALYAWPFNPGEGFDPNELGPDGDHIKVNLNSADAGTIAARIAEVYAGAGGAALPAGVANVGEFAEQLTANILAYREDDNRLPEYEDRYGMEALPFLAEVYAQRYYEAAVVDEDNGAAPDEIRVTWTAQGQAGFAIEIANPFRKPIPLTEIELYIDDDLVETLDELAGDEVDTHNQDEHGSESGDRRLYPDDVLLLYQDSTDAGGNQEVWELFTDDPDEEERRIEVDLALSPPAVTWPDTPGWTEAPAGEEPIPAPIDVELRVTAYNPSTGNETDLITYSRAHAVSLPDEYIDNHDEGDPENPEDGDTGYWQHASVGNGAGVNPMLIPADEWAADDSRPDTEYRDDDAFLALGKEDKTDVAGAPTNEVEPDEVQIIIRDDEFMHVGELSHLSVLAPTAMETVAEAFQAGASDLEEFMLDFAPVAGNIVSVENHRVPYAAMLMDQFTTYESHEDDGQMVPGLVALNTMPEHLLAKVLPIPDPVLRDEVAERIFFYRGDDLTGDPNAIADARADMLASILGKDPDDIEARTAPGIAHTGELFMLFNDILTTDNWGDYDGDVEMIDGTRVDFLANPADDEADGIANDREEAMMIAKWLSQVGSTRSDYFAAHVLVRGYRQDGEFEATDIEESVRFIAIFRRRLAEVDGEMEVAVDRVMPTGDPRQPYRVR